MLLELLAAPEQTIDNDPLYKELNQIHNNLYYDQHPDSIYQGEHDGYLSDEEIYKKESLMYYILRCKFSQNQIFLRTLLNTKDAELIKICTRDKFWSTVNGEGRNALGKILMALRENFREEANQNNGKRWRRYDYLGLYSLRLFIQWSQFVIPIFCPNTRSLISYASEDSQTMLTRSFAGNTTNMSGTESIERIQRIESEMNQVNPERITVEKFPHSTELLRKEAGNLSVGWGQ